jgi:hypothetical protein
MIKISFCHYVNCHIYHVKDGIERELGTSYDNDSDDGAFKEALEMMPPGLWQETLKEYERIKNEQSPQ